jgi:hypothetical protein
MADPITILYQVKLRLQAIRSRLMKLEAIAKDESLGRVERLRAQFLVHQFKASCKVRVFEREYIIAEYKARPLYALITFLQTRALHMDEIRMIKKFLL